MQYIIWLHLTDENTDPFDKQFIDRIVQILWKYAWLFLEK